MSTPNLRMADWMQLSDGVEQAMLADIAQTSRRYLYKLAAGHKVASAELAGRIEMAAAKLREANPALPRLLRTDLCPACAGCPFVRQCLTGKTE